METKLIKVFYDEMAYPFKDQERTVRFPIVGSAFMNASNTTKIRFYTKDIGGDTRQWIVIGKLPNGKHGFTILGNSQLDSEIGEQYFEFSLTEFYTQYKGDLYLSLGGFNGEIVELNQEEEYEFVGNKVVEMTGAIKLNIAYATPITNGSNDEIDTWQEFLSALGGKLDISKGIITYDTFTALNSELSNYEIGQLFYVKELGGLYRKPSSGSISAENFEMLPVKFAYVNGSDTTLSNIFVDYLQYTQIGVVLTSGGKTYLASIDNDNNLAVYDLVSGAIFLGESVNLSTTFSDFINNTTPKIIAFEDWVNSNFAKLAGNNTFGGNNTFTGNDVFDNSPQTNEEINDASADTKLTTKKYVKELMNEHLGDYNTLKGRVDTIESEIPSQASDTNKLADRDWVNSTINSLAAFYITKNEQGDPFATYSELASATTFYSGGQVRVPTRNDYCLVVSDENHDNASCRYIYQGTQWEFQFVVNETPFTADQLAALNSGITSALVSQIGTNTSAITTINGKLPKIKDFVMPTTSWQLDSVSGRYYAELDAGSDFVINDNAMKNYCGTNANDQNLIGAFGIIASSNSTTQKFRFECYRSDTAPTEVINFTISMFGGN